jgi:hypothetical protein
MYTIPRVSKIRISIYLDIAREAGLEEIWELRSFYFLFFFIGTLPLPERQGWRR